MGQAIAPYGIGATILVMECDRPGCLAHADIYEGPCLIEKRKTAHTDGWRQRLGKWFKGECVPNGKEQDDG